MKSKIKWWTAILTGACLEASLPKVNAHGIRLPDQDARASARGEAFAATADNASAIYYNPAGIAQLAGHNVRLGAYLLSFRSTYDPGDGRSSGTKDAVHVVPHLFYTYAPKTNHWALGLGIYSPFGLSVKWPEDTGFRSLVTQGRVTYQTLNPVAAWQIHPSLSLGGGLTLNRAEIDLHQGLSPVPWSDEFKFKGDDTALGFNVGLLWKPHSKHSFGLTYSSQTTFDLRGQTQTRSSTPLFSLSQSAAAGVVFPQHIVLGWSYRPTPNWNLEFNADWTDWDAVNSLQIRQATPLPPLVLNWKSSVFYEWGVTRYFNKGYSVSAGYIFNENSVPDAHFNPVVADTDRHFFSVGIGRQIKRVSWDVTYQFGYGEPRVVKGSSHSMAGQSADGRYDFSSHGAVVSFSYRF